MVRQRSPKKRAHKSTPASTKKSPTVRGKDGRFARKQPPPKPPKKRHKRRRKSRRPYDPESLLYAIVDRLESIGVDVESTIPISHSVIRGREVWLNFDAITADTFELDALSIVATPFRQILRRNHRRQTLLLVLVGINDRFGGVVGLGWRQASFTANFDAAFTQLEFTAEKFAVKGQYSELKGFGAHVRASKAYESWYWEHN